MTTGPVAYTDLSQLAALKRDARASDPQALREVAKQFEGIFMRMMLKSMRDASFGDSVFGSQQETFYRDMFDDQLALQLSNGRGIGLADALVQQLTRAGLAPPQRPGSTQQGDIASQRPQTSVPVFGLSGDLSAELPAALSAEPLEWSAFAPSVSAPSVALPDFSTPAQRSDATRVVGSPWRNATREDFVRDVWPHAVEAGRQLGVDPATLVAHAALETGWGRSLPCDSQGNCSFNLFGIKATGGWGGGAVASRTIEFVQGVAEVRAEKFRAYESAGASFRDYAAMLGNNPRYVEVRGTGSDAKGFAGALQRAGYATDPDYARKLSAVAEAVGPIATGLRLKAPVPAPISRAAGAF